MVDAESDVGVPMAVTVYVLAETLATTKDAVSVPPEIEQVDEATAPLESAHEVSLVEKPEPETITSRPTEFDVGLSVMVGVPPVTVSEVEAESLA